MRILGIETSCDETSAALVENGARVLSNIVYSQVPLHQMFRGVVPEIASRAHVEKINAVLQKALGKGTRPDAIAVTVGPGLVGSLLVGKMTAEALAWSWDIPVMGIHHLEAHLYSARLLHPNLNPPFLGFVVSGGHTHLFGVKRWGDYFLIGRTRDDSAGESFDKVASLLQLPYPGGPVIDRLAKDGNAARVLFPRAYLPENWDFSFSGLKTAVLYHLQKDPYDPVKKKTVSGISLADLCASFQSAVVDVLVRKSLKAARSFGFKKIVLGGGVSANSLLRQSLFSESKAAGLTVYFPDLVASTDNAAMVAGLAYQKFLKQPKKMGFQKIDLTVHSSLPMSQWGSV